MVIAVWLYRTTRPQPTQDQIVPRQTDTAVPGMQSQTEDATLEAGRKQLEQLRQSQSAAIALEWLRKRLEQNTELEPLRAEIPRLDALATGETIVQLHPQYDEMDSNVTALLARYPKSSEVPLLLARTLKGKVEPAWYPLSLYREAISRGADPRDRQIFELSIQLFSRAWPSQLDTAHDLLRQHFGNEALSWAQRAIDSEESGVTFRNAWRILRERNDSSVNDPYYKALERLTYGYEDDPEADHDLAVFQQVTGRARQDHILQMYRWVLKPLEEKGVGSFSYSHRDLAERNLAKLRETWNRP